MSTKRIKRYKRIEGRFGMLHKRTQRAWEALDAFEQLLLIEEKKREAQSAKLAEKIKKIQQKREKEKENN